MLNPDISLVTVSGKAGTGKTLLALAAGLAKKKFYRQMFIARPVVPLSNKDLAYIIEKMKGQKLYAHINLEKGERSELAELASKIL